MGMQLLTILGRKSQEWKFESLSMRDYRMCMTTSCWILTRLSTNWKKGITPMNNYRVTLTRQAKDNIIDIGDYISYTLLEPGTSRNFIKGLRNSISQLKYFPYKFPLIMQVIVVLRVGYNQRNWKDILS